MPNNQPPSEWPLPCKPELTLLVIAVSQGIFQFGIEPAILQLAPLHAWPLEAQILYWASPCVAWGALLIAMGLAFGWINGVWRDYFNSKKTRYALLALAIGLALLISWSGTGAIAQLLVEKA